MWGVVFIACVVFPFSFLFLPKCQRKQTEAELKSYWSQGIQVACKNGKFPYNFASDKIATEASQT
jgi:hypothetical protein